MSNNPESPDARNDITRGVDSNGSQFWTKGGLLHRDDGPAIIYRSGTEEWYRNGLRHREGGPAAIYANGTQEWYYNGFLHREGGPARIGGKAEEWLHHGSYHRTDGPACICYDGAQRWWVSGQNITDEVLTWMKDKGFPPYSEWTLQERELFKSWASTFCRRTAT
jgi:hypothetical protein